MRDLRIDLLRCFGLCLIILAHCSPPYFLFQIRNFDVPMMVLISGVSFGLSFKQRAYADYVASRFKRLLLPVWCFLSIYFLSCLAFSFPSELPGFAKIVSSYLLDQGIGFVWIIRVFLMVALIAPLIFHIHKRMTNNLHFLLVLFCIGIANEFLLMASSAYLDTPAGIVIEKTIFYVIPYGIIFAFGLRLTQLTQLQMIISGLLIAAVFVIYCSYLWLGYGEFIPTQEYKYPPQIYYYSYALCISILLWMGAAPLLTLVQSLKLTDLVMLMGQNSIWIYLWHIPFVVTLSAPFYIKYPFILLMSVLVTFLQVWLLNKVILPRINNPAFKRNVITVFTG